MKQKNFTKKFKLMLVLGFALLVGQNTIADDIVGYDLTSDNTATLGLGIPGNDTGTFSTSSSLTSPSFDGNDASSSGWNAADQYWTISPFSTEGLHTISVGAFMFSDPSGPKDFELQYKIGAGSWINAGAITLTGTTASKTIVLPAECANQTNLSVRWLNSTSVAVNLGGVSNGALSFIHAISIVGTLPTRPLTNASNITFVSITPTTITVDATAGEGDHRIIYIVKNTTGAIAPSFPIPADNQVFSANPDYSTGDPTGYQVVYNGTGTNVTITVPSSTNEYWVRIFNYYQNGTMPRYVTTSPTKNPNLCALATIVTDPATLIRLTTATIGATVSASKSAILARGTMYSLGVSMNGATSGFNKLGVAAIDRVEGSKSRALTSLTRGSTYYYKGYVTNTSGTIYSEELIFNNVPIFTGSGTWETPELWNVLQVPGSTGTGGFGNILDSPTINGTCTLTADNSVTNLTINSTKKLSINAATTLTVAGTLANSATTNGLVIGAGNGTIANASLIFSNKALNQNVPASVEMYSKASTAGGNHWQYFGVPVQTQTVGTTFGGSERVRRFNEANFDPTGNDYGLWYPYPVSTMAADETLSPVVGYEVVQSSAKTYTFKGNLNAADFNHPLAYTTVPQLADYAGQNIIANPYTAAIDIPTLLSNNPSLDEAAVYIYNTGSREEWTANNGELNPGSNAGTYSVSTGEFAGIFGVPAQIPSMQGFLMKTNSPKTLNIPYSSVVTNNKPQRAPALDQKVATMIDVIGSKSSDRMWIFSEPTCTRNYDNGFDGRKILGYNTQLFAMEGSEDYQIDAVNDINNTYLGFQSGSETNLKLKFTHQNLEDKYSRVYLTDLVENKTIDITVSGTEYVFTAVPSTTPSQRFKITTSTTDNITPDAGEQIKIFGSQGNAVVQNLSNAHGNVFIYTMAGQFVRNVPFSANGVTTISNLKAGAYIVKAKTAENEVNSYLIIR